MTKACWKCDGHHTDSDGLCRICGADTAYQPRPPTEEEAGPWARAVRNGPQASTIDRNIAALEKVEAKRRLRMGQDFD